MSDREVSYFRPACRFFREWSENEIQTNRSDEVRRDFRTEYNYSDKAGLNLAFRLGVLKFRASMLIFQKIVLIKDSDHRVLHKWSEFSEFF